MLTACFITVMCQSVSNCRPLQAGHSMVAINPEWTGPADIGQFWERCACCQALRVQVVGVLVLACLPVTGWLAGWLCTCTQLVATYLFACLLAGWLAGWLAKYLPIGGV
jgi:hypothetical protein